MEHRVPYQLPRAEYDHRRIELLQVQRENMQCNRFGVIIAGVRSEAGV